MLELSKINAEAFKKLKHPKIGSNKLLDTAVQECVSKIADDLTYLTKNGLDPLHVEADTAAFKQFVDFLVLYFPASSQKQALYQVCRQLACVMKLRVDTLGDKEHLIADTLNVIDSKIGVVPSLNSVVTQPDEKFLPPQYQTSVKRWSKEAWKNPTRDKSGKGEKIQFYTREANGHQYASVRLHLIEQDKSISPEGESLSYCDADFFAHGDLQADHLQPSSNILERQQELIAMMNIDPLYKTVLFTHPLNRDYFVEDLVTSEVNGSKRFFMDYHNAIDNLWLMRPADNTGTGKSNVDPITWLASHSRFGERFLETVRPINKAGILYTTKDGEVLAKAARKWFQSIYHEEITGVRFYSEQVIVPFKQLLLNTSQPDPSCKIRKHANIATMVAMAMAKQGAEIAGETTTCSDEDRLSSIDSADAEITTENLSIIVEQIAKEKDEKKEHINRIARSYRAERKSAKRKRDSDNEETTGNEFKSTPSV